MLNLDVFWCDLGSGPFHKPECLQFDPHPRDFEVESLAWPEMLPYMNSRQEDVTEMLARLGDADSWTGTFKDQTLFGPDSKRDEICARVVDLSTCVVTTLVRVGSGETETIITVPVSRVERFIPQQAVDAIEGLTEKNRIRALAEIQDMVDLYKGSSLVFSFNTNAWPTLCWFLTGRATYDFRPTLVRAILRWAMHRDGISPADLAAGRSGQGKDSCVVHKDLRGPVYRFTVRYPWGTQFSDAFVRVLKDLGYQVVLHPDINFNNDDSVEWFASKNREHLDEVIRLLQGSDWSDEEEFEKRLQALGDVMCGGFDWKQLDPAALVKDFGDQFGMKIRWSEGGLHGRGEFHQFLIEPQIEPAG